MADTDPPESWNEKTDPDSLYGMRKAIKANTATANNALDWAVRTHDLVTRIHAVVSRDERQRAVSTVLISAGVSLLISAVVAACAAGAR